MLFTGDLLFNDQRTLDGAQLPLNSVDLLVTETTRGSTAREPGKQRESENRFLLEDTRRTLSRGGSVLIPVFALGRMQEMLVVLDEAFRRKAIPKVPVFCSGLGMDLVNHFHEISKNTNRIRFNRKVLKTMGARPLPRKIEPGRPPPMQGIFLVSSGMMVEHTPSYVIASGLLGNDRNSILFVDIATLPPQVDNFWKPNPDNPSHSMKLNAWNKYGQKFVNSISVGMPIGKNLSPLPKNFPQNHCAPSR